MIIMISDGFDVNLIDEARCVALQCNAITLFALLQGVGREVRGDDEHPDPPL